MNRFLFVRCSQVQKLLSSVSAGLEKHRRRCVWSSKRTNRYSVANSLQSSRGGFRFCCFC